MNRDLREVPAPQVFHSDNITWTYLDSGDLLNGGIYTEEQVDDFVSLRAKSYFREDISDRQS